MAHLGPDCLFMVDGIGLPAQKTRQSGRSPVGNRREDEAGLHTKIKAAIFWHERWQNKDESYSNLRVNSSPEALSAYREGVKADYRINHPRFQPLK